MNEIISQLPFKIVATAIDKRDLKTQYNKPENPYELALEFCLERAHHFLHHLNQSKKLTHLVVESRGAKEDKDLELAFRRIMDKKGMSSFDIVFADKRVNSAGLQLADLVAHPIGRHVIDPSQENRAFKILEEKFREYPNYHAKGLKIFPSKSIGS